MTSPHDQPPPDESASSDVNLYGLPVSDPSQSEAGRDAVELAATEFADELRRGLRPSIDAYVRRYPRHAARIREILPLVASIESWKTNRELSGARQSLPARMHLERLGNCRIVREIGRGGMGIVFEAVEEPEGRRVAVKLLAGRFSETSQWRQRFEREARVTAGLRHPHIIPVYAVGVHNEWCFYVMQLVEGLGLDRVIHLLREPAGAVYAEDIRRLFAGEQRSTVPALPSTRVLRRDAWAQYAKIGMQVAGALKYAHARKTLHRDIKPANLLLDCSGSVWVTDFGIALRMDALVGHRAEHVGGTLAYVAPEQIAGRADERSDIYSLGTTLYELCTLQPARDASSREELLQQLRTLRPPRPRSINRNIPSQLERIILKAMARDPAQRFQSAGELQAALRTIVQGSKDGSSGSGWLDPLGRFFPRGGE